MIFLDELDKCPEYFYSAFYTLFDNTLFQDATYDVDISGVVIVLTSNYLTEEEMKKYLGLPIFYRIDELTKIIAQINPRLATQKSSGLWRTSSPCPRPCAWGDIRVPAPVK